MSQSKQLDIKISLLTYLLTTEFNNPFDIVDFKDKNEDLFFNPDVYKFFNDMGLFTFDHQMDLIKKRIHDAQDEDEMLEHITHLEHLRNLAMSSRDFPEQVYEYIDGNYQEVFPAYLVTWSDKDNTDVVITNKMLLDMLNK